MTKSFISYLFLFTSWVSCFSQTEPDEDKGVNININRRYRNEVGIDISPFTFILNSPSAGYGSFFYRRHFTKERPVKGLSGVNKTTYHAYRVRLGSNLSFERFIPPEIRDEFYDNYYYYYNTNNFLSSYLFMRLGQERQFRSGKFELLAGYDLFAEMNKTQYLWIRNQGYNQGQTNQYYFNEQYGYTEKNLRFGIGAIGGFKYFLIPRLCFSAEGTFNLGFLTGSKKNFYKSYNSSTDILKKDSQQVKIEGFRLNANPLFVVNMGYYFK